MQTHALVAIVTLCSLLVYFAFGLGVARARRQTGIAAPQMTGHPTLERAVRVHENTLEWLPIYLPSLWLFAFYWNDLVAAGLGVVWIAGRLVYAVSYMKEPGSRELGFGIQALACGVLLLGALGKAAWVYAAIG
ncbi:MAPEG family protein [Phenylobacterium sp.]|uniref:MAPEG family protein n=1 Tax=Phenylobacterium sp. TaxID=1871053 RepID=UPI0035AE0E3D